MNDKQANSIKELAAPVIKVLERLKVACQICKGKGYIQFCKEEPDQIICRDCTKGKVHYSWTPQVGEFYLLEGKVFLVKEKPYECGKSFYKLHEDAIPILEWEVIEEILEKAGYWIEVSRRNWGELIGKVTCRISGYSHKIKAEGKSRIAAVYDAVDKLRKEMK
ncbi:hypothetical protein LCGC14_0940280 [marine sediment metagenome]|uniref:Uncharacterized protein n=1 Tax=marine sediment metagenome TaxID=412755 RepID=A0A0F9R3X5_9ZZZZ